MKNLKNISLLIICIIAMFLITGCVKNEKVEGTLEELMTKVYAELPEDKTPMMLTNIEVTDENIEYYLGTSDIEYEEALACESATGSIAHSVVLVRAKENADVEAMKTKIKESVDPRKWICVGVEEDEVVVKNKGDLIILIMVQDGRENLETSFDNL